MHDGIKGFLSLGWGRVSLVSETENFPFTEMLYFYYCLGLLHLFALEHFSAGTVNEYERDCICVDSTGLLHKVLKSALVAENAAVSLQIQMVS